MVIAPAVGTRTRGRSRGWRCTDLCRVAGVAGFQEIRNGEVIFPSLRQPGGFSKQAKNGVNFREHREAMCRLSAHSTCNPFTLQGHQFFPFASLIIASSHRAPSRWVSGLITRKWA